MHAGRHADRRRTATTFAGTVKVKLGPITLTYQGKGRFVERDEAARRVVIEASGKDARSAGTAAATVTATLTGAGDTTTVDVVTDLKITGRPAQFGRGMIAEVSGKLLGQFADCLAETLGSAPAGAPASGAPASGAAASGSPAGGAAAAGSQRRPARRRVEQKPPEQRRPLMRHPPPLTHPSTLTHPPTVGHPRRPTPRRPRHPWHPWRRPSRWTCSGSPAAPARPAGPAGACWVSSRCSGWPG